VGSSAHRAIAREAVRKSQVLLKNANNILPLAKSGGKIFVAGKTADNIGNQSGGWTISWQGSSGNITTGTTILQGIRAAVGSGTTVTYSVDGTGIDSTYRAAIAVVGETPYAEGQGDRPGSLSLDTTDLNTISRLRAAGVPVIVVLVSGRPMDISSQLGNWNALLASWLPGTEGAGVADVLFGDYNPTGKLPMTWMQSVSQQPINDGDGKTPLFTYGFGLSYSGGPTSPPPTSAPPTSAPPTSAPPTSAPPTTTRPPTSAPPTTTRPPTSAPPTTTRPPTSAPPTTGGSTCSVAYRITSSWQGNFQADVTLRNTGTGTINGWALTWTFANGQTISQLWNGAVTQSGASVTVRDIGWNGTLGPNGSASFGFISSWNNSTNAVPTSFAVNGSPCALA
jgi:beta-glucosidase